MLTGQAPAWRHGTAPFSNLSWSQWFKPVLVGGLYAVLLFSPLSLKVFTIYGAYLIEAPLSVCLIITRIAYPHTTKSYLSLFRDPRVSITLGVVLLLCLIGLFSTFDIKALAKDARSFLFWFLSLLLVYKWVRDNDPIINALLSCALFSSLSWLLLLVHIAGEQKYGVPVFVPLAAAALCAHQRRLALMLVTIAMALIMSIGSGYRSYIVLSCLVSVITASMGVLKCLKHGNIGRIGVAAATLSVVIAIGLSAIGSMLSDFLESDVGRRHLVTKTDTLNEALFESKSLDASDEQRWYVYEQIFAHPEALLFPHGFGVEAMVDDLGAKYDTGVLSNEVIPTRDSGLLYLLYSGGFFVVTVVLGFWLKSILSGLLGGSSLQKAFRWLVIAAVLLSLFSSSDMLQTIVKGVFTSVWIAVTWFDSGLLAIERAPRQRVRHGKSVISRGR
jgi:hypothetical protein